MATNDDPFFRPETKLRPRPGGGRQPQAPRTQVSGQTSAAAPFDATPIPAAARALIGIGLNPLVRAATPLLLMAAQIRGSMQTVDVAGLRRSALDEIHQFEDQARAGRVPNEVVLAARYVLCAAVDEAVLSTPWGNQSEWAQHPLLVALHRETWGGEKFFDMLDRTSKDPSKFIDLMELQYLALAFGFAGKYEVQERGQDKLLEIQQRLYRQIRERRGASPAGLSLRWRGLEDRRNPILHYLPWWVVSAAALPILAIAFTAWYASLAGAAAPIQSDLARIGLEDFSTPPPAAPVRGPSLKQLLASDEQSGALSVDEQGSKTTVTLPAADLFPSGSATVNESYYATLRRVADALNKVPGRVLVVGHTDSQPIKSLRFQDNFELSRERAVSVVNLLKQGSTDPARFQWTGVGSSEPKYDESDPANRSRNRRVEIVHVRSS
ncbi:MAG TPA: type IVB secretion system protein IcmH/DotU [Vicinamibacterales bacterium]|nr:type IVB secretion system protein IcmH/DotU [Vicinamibacterales bacterium]